jgi:hypothetical protein
MQGQLTWGRGKRRPEQGHQRSPEHGRRADRRWAAEGRHQRAERESQIERKKWSLARCSGWRPFLKTRYGRTGQSTMSVRWTTWQRTGESGSARSRPVHRIVHSAVSGAHGTVRWAQTEGRFGFFEFFYLVPNQTKSQLINTQNNTCWDRYWHPHIFSHNWQNIFP